MHWFIFKNQNFNIVHYTIHSLFLIFSARFISEKSTDILLLELSSDPDVHSCLFASHPCLTIHLLRVSCTWMSVVFVWVWIDVVFVRNRIDVVVVRVWISVVFVKYWTQTKIFMGFISSEISSSWGFSKEDEWSWRLFVLWVQVTRIDWPFLSVDLCHLWTKKRKSNDSARIGLFQKRSFLLIQFGDWTLYCQF